MKRVRLIDVAQKTGYAPSTVSMILNRDPNSWSSEATQEKVFKAAREMGYSPSRAAVGLRAGRFHTIGLIVPDLGNPHYCRMADMIDRKLDAKGYDTLVLSARLSSSREQHCVRSICERQIDGVLHCPFDTLSLDRSIMEKLPVPLVLIGSDIAKSNLRSVLIDYQSGLEEAFAYLYRIGHRRFAFLSAASPEVDSDFREGVFHKQMAALGLPESEGSVIRTGPTMEASRDALSQFLRETPPDRRPTAVLALNDISAIGVMRAAAEFGLDVPGDLSVVGNDNIALAAYLPRALTTIKCNMEKLTDLAIERLIDQVESESETPQASTPEQETTLLPTHLVIRESTAPV